MFDATTIPVLEQVVNFAQSRHGVLAGNIANFDTPGYRARDLSPERFEARLKTALEGRDRAPISQNSSGVTSLMGRESVDDISDSMETILHHDDSNVSLEHHVAELTKNQMQHNLALTIMTSQFRLLQVAISERV